jgi:chorismate dehydratase
MLSLAHGLGDLRLDDGRRLEVHPLAPSLMIRRMEEGGIDLGMAPVAGVFDRPEWRIVGESAIASRGAVKSVLAISLEPPERWTVIRPDSHSRTSNALAQVLAAGRHGVRPKLGEPIPAEGWTPPEAPAPGEAFVLIGSRALAWRDLWRERGAIAIDLGQAWTEWTGLPFVYAVWAARPGVEAEAWMPAFEALKRRNMARLGEIVGDWPGLGEERLSVDEAIRYLTENLTMELDEKALAGLERFHRQGRSLGLFKSEWELELAR